FPLSLKHFAGFDRIGNPRFQRVVCVHKKYRLIGQSSSKIHERFFFCIMILNPGMSVRSFCRDVKKLACTHIRCSVKSSDIGGTRSPTSSVSCLSAACSELDQRVIVCNLLNAARLCCNQALVVHEI